MANCMVSTGNSSGVNVRSSKAVSSSNLLGVIDNGVYVNVVRCDGTWATLMYQGAPAFLQHQYLMNPPTTNGDGLDTGSNNKAACNGNDVNIRDAANGSITGNTLDKGDSVTIYQKSLVNGYYWYRIGTNQWVRGDFLAPGGSGGGSTGGGSFIGYGTVINGDLYCRKQPISGYDEWGLFSNGSEIPIYTCSTPGWYETRWPATGNDVGYVVSQFVSLDGSSGGGSTSHTAIVCQGNTTDAGDCVVFYNELNDVYSSVVSKGFSPSTGSVSSTRASQSDFQSAANYDVLYWSSHGNSTPYLNLGSNQFNSYNAANSAWNSTSDDLKVVILAACHQLDGATNRSQWASIMRQSDIRAICGYHEGAPGHPYDENLAEDFFSYVNAGTTGNSVMYCWQHANQDNGNNSTYMVLVYQNDNQCYYRLPGFSSQTYCDPNRSTDSIYAYASFMTGAVSTAAAQPNFSNLLPYELEIAETVIPAAEVEVPRSVCLSWQKPTTGATFIGYGEFPHIPVDVEVAQELNMTYATQAFGTDLLACAQIRNVDTVMFEVFDDGTEGEQTIIGHATQFLNHYNGTLISEPLATASANSCTGWPSASAISRASARASVISV